MHQAPEEKASIETMMARIRKLESEIEAEKAGDKRKAPAPTEQDAKDDAREWELRELSRLLAAHWVQFGAAGGAQSTACP